MFHLSRLAKLYVQTVLTFFFFLLEAIVGYSSGSISLVADSFHMLSDLLGLGVAIYAIRLGQRTTFSEQLSFGFQRAEVLGALVNSVFLLALCFTILMESIQRFFAPHEIGDPKLVLIVGAAGALVNIIGVVMFGGHHHDEPDEPKLTQSEEEQLVKDVFSETASRTNIDLPQPIELLDERYQRRKSSMVTVEINENGCAARRGSTASTTSTKSARTLGSPADGGHLNMHGVFLHMLGDLLGSITVIISALVMWLATSWENRFIIDPIVSIIITVAIVCFTLPLARTSARILLQATPGHISHGVVKRALLLVPGVQGVHELHIWQLSDTKTIASLHIRLTPEANVLDTVRAVKEVMCGFGVCATTVQPEQLPPDALHTKFSNDWVDTNGVHGHGSDTSGCLVRCNRPACQENYCCSEDRVRNEDNERVTYGGFWFGVGPAAEMIRRAESKRISHRMHDHEHHNHRPSPLVEDVNRRSVHFK